MRPTVVPAVLIAYTVSPAYAATPKTALTGGVTPSYFQGDYGTGQTTKIWYLPAYLQYRQDDWRVKLTVPLIRVESPGAVVSGGTVIAPGASQRTTTHSGIGDIWLEGRYTLHGTGSAPDLAPYGKIKFGTASRSNGLGTGENDYEAGLELDWVTDRTVFPYVSAGYRIVGKPPGWNLQDIYTYEAGTIFATGSSRYFTAMLSGRESMQPGGSAPLDALFAWDFLTRPGSGWQVYMDKGLSNGSPDFGVGIGVHTRF